MFFYLGWCDLLVGKSPKKHIFVLVPFHPVSNGVSPRVPEYDSVNRDIWYRSLSGFYVTSFVSKCAIFPISLTCGHVFGSVSSHVFVLPPFVWRWSDGVYYPLVLTNCQLLPVSASKKHVFVLVPFHPIRLNNNSYGVVGGSIVRDGQ